MLHISCCFSTTNESIRPLRVELVTGRLPLPADPQIGRGSAGGRYLGSRLGKGPAGDEGGGGRNRRREGDQRRVQTSGWDHGGDCGWGCFCGCGWGWGCGR